MPKRHGFAFTQDELRELVQTVLDRAKAGGAHGCDCEVSEAYGLTTTVRKEAVRRCIANLVNNAVRHGRHVALAAWRKGNMIEITVDDDGPGIPAEERETVFRPFHRLDASRNVETGGVGLGLTIAREVVHGHGGEIFLEDSPMGGLRARIRLPV